MSMEASFVLIQESTLSYRTENSTESTIHRQQFNYILYVRVVDLAYH